MKDLIDQSSFLICDIETERLINPQKVWVAVTIEVKTNEVKVWKNLHEDAEEFNNYVQDFILVGHNFINFDAPVLRRVAKTTIVNVVDTLVISRFLYSWLTKKHGLEYWGEVLGEKKGNFKDFHLGLSDEMIKYCIQDCKTNLKLFKKMLPYMEKFEEPLQLEHWVAHKLKEMSDNGFGFNIELAREVYAKLKNEADNIENEIQKEFPPKSSPIREVTPKLTANGKLSKVDFRWLSEQEANNLEDLGYEEGCTFSRFEWIKFNPNSTKQIIERFNEFGWKPVIKTKGHLKAIKNNEKDKFEYYNKYGWQVNEENIATLPDNAPPSAGLITRFILLSDRLSTLDEWLTSYNEETKSIHPTIIHIGAWTHRCSHKAPNCANIPRVTTEYGGEFRAMWEAREGRRLIGCDAEGIQLRILSHYMEDPVFQKALLEGDPHSLNRDNLRLEPTVANRTRAKTFIYAWVLGAALPKVGEILDCTPKEAGERVAHFIEAYPGLKRLKEEIIPQFAQQGFFVGFDGRPVQCDSNHLMLAGMLQAGESVIMKTAFRIWYETLTKEKIPFWAVNFVHDEFQTETIDDNDVVNFVKQVQEDSIKQAGEILNLRCPQQGKANDGFNWKDTH